MSHEPWAMSHEPWANKYYHISPIGQQKIFWWIFRNLESFYAEPKYVKDHQTSIRFGAIFINNPIEFMLNQIDQSQATIFDFIEETSEEENEVDDY